MITMEGILPEEVINEMRQVSLANEIGENTINFNVKFIVEEICFLAGITEEQMKSKSRKREHVLPRQIAMYLIKERYFSTMSLKSVGNYFGGRDHSTVIHAMETINDLLDTDKDFKKEFNYYIKHFDSIKENYNMRKSNQ